MSIRRLGCLLIILFCIPFLSAIPAQSNYKSYLSLAEKLVSAGELGRSVNFFEQALHNLEDNSQISDEPQRHILRMKILSVLKDIHISMGNINDIENVIIRRIKIADLLFPYNKRYLLKSISDAALFYMKIEKFEIAKGFLDRHLKLSELVFGLTSQEYAFSLGNIGNYYSSKGEYARALQVYERSLSLITSSGAGKSHQYAATLNNIANSLMRAGDMKGAEEKSRDALKLLEQLGREPHERLGPITTLASIYDRTGQVKAAEALHLEACAITRHDQFRAEHAVNLHNYSMHLMSRARYRAAYAEAETAHAINEKIFGSQSEHATRSLNLMGRILIELGDLNRARQMLRKAAENGDPDRAYLRVLNGSDPSDFEESFATIQRLAGVEASLGLNQLAVRVGAGSEPMSALVRTEQDLSRRIAAVDAARIALLSKDETPNPLTKQQLEQQLQQLREEQAHARATLKEQFPDYAELSKPGVIPSAQVINLIRDDEAFVVLDSDAEGVFSWVITKESRVFKKTGVSTDEVKNLVSALRRSLDLTSNSRPDFEPEQAFKLYKLFLKPIEPYLQNKSHLIFMLSGDISSLPPGLLIKSAPRTADLSMIDWLILSHGVTVMPTATSLKFFRSRNEPNNASKLLRAYADPVFQPDNPKETDVRSVSNLKQFFGGKNTNVDELRRLVPNLPATRVEVERVARALNVTGKDLVLGKNANEMTVKADNLSDYRIVYFATHALVSGEVEEFAKNRSEPALILSLPDAPSDVDDGLLTSSEIAMLNLNADWVVLSACNTAAGGRPGASALTGLAQAFFYAGARSLLVSHWAVEDVATANFMVQTFSHFAADPDIRPADALRKAKVNMIHDRDRPQWSHPVYWAPFVHVGSPGQP